MSAIISRLANYEGGVVPHFEADDDLEGIGLKKNKAPPKVGSAFSHFTMYSLVEYV